MMSPDARDYLHFQWTMPAGVPGGPTEPVVFSVITTQMRLVQASSFVDGLHGIIDERNVVTLARAVHQLLTEPGHGPEQLHVMAFASAPVEEATVLQAGTMVLFKLLEKKWPAKTMAIIPVPWPLFARLQQVATQDGFWPTPPPSCN